MVNVLQSPFLSMSVQALTWTSWRAMTVPAGAAVTERAPRARMPNRDLREGILVVRR
jgi:hypothetical protein